MLGGSFHSGVLAAIHDATDWDARKADVIVGTSAGATTAASLRAGLSPADHFARATGSPPSDEGTALLGRIERPYDIPDRRPRLRGLGNPTAARLVWAAVRTWPIRPMIALAGLLPRGEVDGSAIRDRIDAMAGGDWPDDKPVWICAVRLDNGNRVVFGRDDVSVGSFGAAVHASSAVPGFIRPVTIDDVEYVDGAAHSATNADLLAGLELDLVVVISPKSGPLPDASWRCSSIARIWSGSTLYREVDAVIESGTEVVVVEPDAALGVLLDSNSMNRSDRSKRAAVARAAYERSLRQFHEIDLSQFVDRAS
ncbi:MAG: hypothetical protein JJLCMIEE_01591 [Acidimicrobiales bacterium]|nr:hypothetical protein [Acidimicrobiales bacterium]